MHYIDDLSCDEIATLLETSPGAVRARLYRARQELRQQLASLARTELPEEKIAMIEARIEDAIVRVAEDDRSTVVADHRIVLLKEANGERLLPDLDRPRRRERARAAPPGEAPPRPMTSDLMANLVRLTAIRIEHVAITSLHEQTFHAAIRILRHSKINVTMEIYTHVPPASTQAALKRLGRSLDSSAGGDA